MLLSRTAQKCKFYLSLVIISIDVWLRYSRETLSTIRIHNCACEVLLTMQILIAYIFIRLNEEITCTSAEFAGELIQLPTKKTTIRLRELLLFLFIEHANNWLGICICTLNIVCCKCTIQTRLLFSVF